MSLNLTAIRKNPIFETEKITNNEVINKTIKDICICTKDNETFITVRTTDDKHFFASGTLARLLNDNLDVGFTDEFGNISFTENIVVTFKGQKRSKAGRLYNDWEIIIQE